MKRGVVAFILACSTLPSLVPGQASAVADLPGSCTAEGTLIKGDVCGITMGLLGVATITAKFAVSFSVPCFTIEGEDWSYAASGPVCGAALEPDGVSTVVTGLTAADAYELRVPPGNVGAVTLNSDPAGDAIAHISLDGPSIAMPLLSADETDGVDSVDTGASPSGCTGSQDYPYKSIDDTIDGDALITCATPPDYSDVYAALWKHRWWGFQQVVTAHESGFMEQVTYAHAYYTPCEDNDWKLTGDYYTWEKDDQGYSAHTASQPIHINCSPFMPGLLPPPNP